MPVFGLFVVIPPWFSYETSTALRFWELSLSVLWGLEKVIYTCDTSKGAGSEARGDGRERGHSLDTNSKPPVAQRAGGIAFSAQAELAKLWMF